MAMRLETYPAYIDKLLERAKERASTGNPGVASELLRDALRASEEGEKKLTEMLDLLRHNRSRVQYAIGALESGNRL